MKEPHITRHWLYNGQSIVLVLFPNGVERVMTRRNFVNQQREGFWTIGLN